MMQYRRRFLIVLCLLIAISGLSAQERPVLTAGIIQNFIDNMDGMDEAFEEIEKEKDFLDFTEKMDEFQESLTAYLYGEGNDFPAFRAAFMQVKNIRAPSVDRVFSRFGLGQRGAEAFFVITLGMTIGLLESKLEAVLSDLDSGETEEFEALADMQNKLAMMRGLIHPNDMTSLQTSMDALLEELF
ncbi:MAG: hypothetical protein LBH35_02715 [Treponema sp.]|jgi:hypothetical protein|nr:hypothetical protein [Treponema sp.]